MSGLLCAIAPKERNNKSAEVRRMDIRPAFRSCSMLQYCAPENNLPRDVRFEEERRTAASSWEDAAVIVVRDYCRTMVPGRTSCGALTLVLGRVVEALSVTIFLLPSTEKVAT